MSPTDRRRTRRAAGVTRGTVCPFASRVELLAGERGPILADGSFNAFGATAKVNGA